MATKSQQFLLIYSSVLSTVFLVVLLSRAKLPGIIGKGKEQPFVRPQAGMIFYNDKGSEKRWANFRRAQ